MPLSIQTVDSLAGLRAFEPEWRDLWHRDPAATPFHVQSTFAPFPFPVATAFPSWSTTVTVHGSADERRAWKRVGPPSDPATAAIREVRHARLRGELLLWRHADRLPPAAWAAVSGRAPLSLLATGSPLRDGAE